MAHIKLIQDTAQIIPVFLKNIYGQIDTPIRHKLTLNPLEIQEDFWYGLFMNLILK